MKWSLDCSYYDKKFDTLQLLLDDILESGMDPNYELTQGGELRGETAWDHIVP